MNKKPEKIEYCDHNGVSFVEHLTDWEQGFNEACDQYEAYIKETHIPKDSLPSEEQIFQLMKNTTPIKFWEKGKGKELCKVYRTIAKAIKERLDEAVKS